MKVETQGHTTIVRNTSDNLNDLVNSLNELYDQFAETNLIVEMTELSGLTPKDLNAFLPLSKTHRKSRHSFVIVANVDFNKVSDKLSVVPTLQEAHDIIEMEEIERDLGL